MQMVAPRCEAGRQLPLGLRLKLWLAALDACVGSQLSVEASVHRESAKEAMVMAVLLAPNLTCMILGSPD